jgi:hypothetical protein
MERKDIKKQLYAMFDGDNTDIKVIVNELALAWKLPVNDIIKQLSIGEEIEKEHTLTSKRMRQIIALQHIVEKSDYYTAYKPTNWAEIELKKEDLKTENVKNIILSYNTLRNLLD